MEKQLDTARRIAKRYALLDIVEAVALAGSVQSGFGSAESDIDLYIYPSRELTMDERSHYADIDAVGRQIIDFWGSSDNWIDSQTGVEVDAMYFTTDWMEEQLARILDRHEAWMGYTTAFWYTIQISESLFDRNGWFARLQEKANQPYPEILVQNIIRQNYPLLRQIRTSYKQQIMKAAKRQDWVSLNHRITEFLASYFDIIFAVNRKPHPGEKRLLAFAAQCDKLPPNLHDDVETLLATGKNTTQIEPAIDSLVDNLDTLLKVEKLYPIE